MTTQTRLAWPPGPPAPVDGLQAAFRAADRRRARTALAAAVPVVVAAALVMTSSLQATGTGSLQLPPAQHVPVTDSNRQQLPAPVGAEAPAPAAGVSAPHTPAAGPASADRTATDRPPVSAAAPDPEDPPPGYVDVVSRGSARGQIRLTRTTHPNFFETAFDRTGRYAGVWVLDAHGTVVGSALEVVTTKGKAPQHYSHSPTLLPAGTYTVYVVGEGPTGAHIPLQPGEKGLEATASRTVSSTYATKSDDMSAAETSGSLRMRLPVATAIGYAGAFIDDSGGAASTVSVCLPRRDHECTSNDPESDGTQFIIGGSVGSMFDLTPRLLRDRRDVLLDANVHATSSTQLVCWAVTVSLS